MQRFFHFIHRVEDLTLVWTILGLAVIGFIQVIARHVFNYSFTWFEELDRYLGVFIAFSGACLLFILSTAMTFIWLAHCRTDPPSAGRHYY